MFVAKVPVLLLFKLMSVHNGKLLSGKLITYIITLQSLCAILCIWTFHSVVLSLKLCVSVINSNSAVANVLQQRPYKYH